MYYYSVVNDSQGEGYPRQTPKAFTKIRTHHWKNSRLALENCLQDFGLDQGAIKSVQDLEILKHHCLKEWPEILVSLAHTRGAACAVSIGAAQNICGVGIDIEKLDRRVNPEIISKFITSSDNTLEDYLKTWCAKEAAFKASSYFWREQKTFVLKDISVDLSTGVFKVKGLLEGDFEFIEEGDFLICIALVTKVEV